MDLKVNNKLLYGKKIAVLVETEFISSEINYYLNFLNHTVQKLSYFHTHGVMKAEY